MEKVESVFIPQSHLPARNFSWRVKLGDTVNRDDILGTYEYATDETEVKAPVNGFIKYLRDPSLPLLSGSSSLY
ncbi:hypothetical protein HK096_000973 [Nowakowskiella sp. JEL0078]|nr:hypothetical protein HK096_000973 [Nowakowskiella sp. JEL0078]